MRQPVGVEAWREQGPYRATWTVLDQGIAAARTELEGKGVKFSQETMDSGVCHMAHFSDPDGNTLMLHHRYAPADAGPG